MLKKKMKKKTLFWRELNVVSFMSKVSALFMDTQRQLDPYPPRLKEKAVKYIFIQRWDSHAGKLVYDNTLSFERKRIDFDKKDKIGT